MSANEHSSLGYTFLILVLFLVVLYLVLDCTIF